MELVSKNSSKTMQIFKDKDGRLYLKSYQSWICRLNQNTGELIFTSHVNYSNTTIKHTWKFLKQYTKVGPSQGKLLDLVPTISDGLYNISQAGFIQHYLFD